MPSLTVLLIIFFTGTVAAFTLKSECLIHSMLEEEAGHEGGDSEGGDHGEDSAQEGERNGGSDERTSNESKEDTDDAGHGFQGQGNFGDQRLYWSKGHNPTDRHGEHRYLDEEGKWEDTRKRRKRGDTREGFRSPHSQDTLVGQLSCGFDSVIHILNVTAGYSTTRQCYQALSGCQAGSYLAKQVIHCQGNKWICDITIGRHFMVHCGHQAHFALVFYECIPATKRLDICSTTSQDISDALVLTSPNYPGGSSVQPAFAGTDIVTCECTIRAPSNSHLELEYIRTHLPITGTTCEGDMFLLERPDPVNKGRYLMELEICGQNVTSHVIVHDHVLRVTFLSGTPLSEGKRGFVAKLKAISSKGTQEIFHVTCVDGHSAQSQDSQLTLTANHTLQPNRKSTTPTSTPSVYTDKLLGWMKVQGRTLPPNFDPTNLPGNFFNLTNEELQMRLPQTRAQSQKVVGAPSEGLEKMYVSGGNDGQGLDTSASGGVLSGVVASLSAVILILGSLGAFTFYRRHQKKSRGHKDALQGRELSETESCTDGSDLRTGKLVTRTTGHAPVVPHKNQKRPLPNPHIHNVDPEGRTRSTSRVSGTQNSRIHMDSETDETVRSVLRSNSTIQDGDALSTSIYTIATSVPDCVDIHEDAETDATFEGQMYASNLEIIPQTQAPPSISHERCQSTSAPKSPPGNKRGSLKNIGETADNHMSPYDNAPTITT